MALPTYPTALDLQNTSRDASTLQKFSNDAAGVPNVNRAGNDVENLETIRRHVLDVAAQTANKQAYLTYDSPSAKRMVDDTSQPAGTKGGVSQDANPENNGDWDWTGTTWLKSPLQPTTSKTVDELRSDMQQSNTEISGRVTSTEQKLEPVVILDQPEYGWVLAQRVSPTSNEYTVLAGLRKADGAFFAPLLDGPGVARAIPDIPGWARVVYSETSPPRALHGVTTSGQIYETINNEFVKIYDPAGSGGTEGAVTPRQALQELLARCMNPFQDVVAVAIGDSITWGTGSTATGPTSPRDHRLTDARSNLTCRSWVNRLREYLGRMYLNIPTDAMPTEEIAPGATAGGAGSYSAPVFGMFWASSHVTVADAGGMPASKTGVQTAAPARADVALSLPVGFSAEVLMNSQTFELVYGSAADPTAQFEIYADGVLIDTVLAYSAAPAWGQIRSVTLPIARPTVVRITNTSSSTAIGLEGIARTKVIRVVNQGISGTSTNSWIPNPNTNGRILLTGALPSNVTDVIIALGTNDRTLTTAEPMPSYGATRYRQNMDQIIRWIQERHPRVWIQLIGGYATLDDGGRIFGQRDLAREMEGLAQEHERVSFLNLYPVLQRSVLEDPAGGSGIFPDNLHPSDQGYAIITNEAIIPYAERTFSR
jgi:lysophospholipase L1-like esterase